MSDKTETLGRKLNSATSVDEFLDLEVYYEYKEQFSVLDSFIGDLFVKSLQGQKIATSVKDTIGNYSIVINGLNVEEQSFLDDVFLPNQQQLRGAWFLPKEVSLRVGFLNLPNLFQQYSRFATNIVLDDRARVLIDNSSSAVVAWSILLPFFELLFSPIEMRGSLSGIISYEEQIKKWAEWEALVLALGMKIFEEIDSMRYGKGWHKLTSVMQLEAKLHFLQGLAQQATISIARRYRVYQLRALVNQYYKKANKDGYAKRKQVLTKALEPIIAAFFGGNWLAFLSFLGEEPHPDEQIVTALPKTRLFVQGVTDKVAEIAAKQGIPIEEAKLILATYWQQNSERSPIEERVDVLEQYWKIFHETHSKQKSGMKSLWGFAEDDQTFKFKTYPEWYRRRLYRKVLPANLLKKVEFLWGTATLSKWPDCIVTELFPYASMLSVLGPALRFWNGCALTAWFICEGPYSRTNLAELSHYHRREIVELQNLGMPINQNLFVKLIDAESKLGLPQTILTNSVAIPIIKELSVTISMGAGTRRSGFETLRKIIDEFRQEWTEKYFSLYLKTRWEKELETASRTYNIFLNQKGKPPTLKQFAKENLLSVNHWFGGNFSGLYGAIREKSPIQPQYVPLIPSDRLSFSWAVFHTLCQELDGKLFVLEKLDKVKNDKIGLDWSVFNALTKLSFDKQEITGLRKEKEVPAISGNLCSIIEELAAMSLLYLQMQEVLGRVPELTEFNQNNFLYYSQPLEQDAYKAWDIYQHAIEIAKNTTLVFPEEDL